MITDDIVSEASSVDLDTHMQVEAGICCDTIWLNGSMVTAVLVKRQISDIVVDTLNRI